jgi:hypothetical protein
MRVIKLISLNIPTSDNKLLNYIILNKYVQGKKQIHRIGRT